MNYRVIVGEGGGYEEVKKVSSRSAGNAPKGEMNKTTVLMDDITFTTGGKGEQKVFICGREATPLDVFMLCGHYNEVFEGISMRLISMETNRHLGKMNAFVSDTYSNHTVVKAYDYIAEKEAEFDELNDNFEKLFTCSRFISGTMRPFSGLMEKVSYIILCLVGGMLMINGGLTLGEFTAFLFYGNMIGVPITELSVAFNNFQDALSSAAGIYEFLDEEEEPCDISKQKLQLQNIDFSYVINIKKRF